MTIASNFTTTRPSLNLNFVRRSRVDPRITFTRTSTATKFNSFGLIDLAAVNETRIDYDPITRQVKGLLIEESRTNLLSNANLTGGGAAPTNWTRPSGTGISAATTSIYGTNDGAIAYVQIATAQRPYLQVSTPIAVDASTVNAVSTYIFSVYVESISGTINLYDVLNIISLPAGASLSAWYLNGVSVPSTTACTVGKVEVVLTVGSTAGSVSPRVGIGTSNVATGSISFSRPQFEKGFFSTSYIPTTTTSGSVTRSADIASINTLSPWYNSSSGTFLIEYQTRYGTTVASIGGNSHLLLIMDNSLSKRIAYLVNGFSTVVTYDGTTSVGTGNSQTANVNKLASSYTASARSICLNNGAVATGSVAAGYTGTSSLNITYPGGSNNLGWWIRKIAYYPAALTTTQMQQLTRGT